MPLYFTLWNGEPMTLESVIRAINGTDETVRVLIERGHRTEIRNERYLHHMFSSYFRDELTKFDWNDLPIKPEYPTNFCFSRDHIDINDPEFTRENAIDVGKQGNLDFLIGGDPEIVIEWKGPVNCPEQDIVEAFLKLLKRDSNDLKIFAAIYTTKSGGRDHLRKLVAKISRSIEFVAKTLDLNDLNIQNLQLFIRSHYEGGVHDICWGPYEGFAPFASLR